MSGSIIFRCVKIALLFFLIPSNSFSQIVASALDPSNTSAFEYGNDSALTSYMNETPSGYVLAPHVSGWKKNSSAYFTGIIGNSTITNTPKNSDEISSLKDGTRSNSSYILGSTFLISRLGFMDINLQNNTHITQPFTLGKTSYEKTRTVQGFNVNGGVRVGQVISIGGGYGQAYNASTITNKSNKVATKNTLHETFAFGLSIRMGALFIGGGADIVNETGKLKNDVSGDEKDLVKHSFNKYYGGVGISTGHPRFVEIHMEANYALIQGHDASNDTIATGETSVSRHEQSIINFLVETIYFDFIFTFGLQLNTFTGMDSHGVKDDNNVFTNFMLGMGYMPANGLFFTLSGTGSSSTGKVTKDENNTDFESPYKVSESGYGMKVSVGVNF